MSTTDKLNLLVNTKERFKDLIAENGKTPTNVFSTYPGMLKDIIAEGGGGGGVTPTPSPEPDPWERPIGRPPVPTDNNCIYFLFGVQENSPNSLAFTVTTTNGGGYTVSWGDVTRNYLSGATFDYEFNWNEIDDNTGTLENDYKMFWISVTPMSSSSSITGLSFAVRPSGHATSGKANIPQVFEMYIKCPELTDLTWPQNAGSSYAENLFTLMEIFSLEENKIVNLSDFTLCNCYSLRQIDSLYIEKVENVFNRFMQNCYAYNQPFPDNAKFWAVGDYFMSGCSAYNQPFPEGVIFESVGIYFLAGCYSYNQPFPKGVTFESVGIYFMQGCYSYNQPFPKGVTFAVLDVQFMYNCSAYNQPFPEGVTFSVVPNYFMSGCSAYNQPFPEGVIFESVDNYFMQNCYAYNQPFPEGTTFESVGNTFMYFCYAYNQPFPEGVTFASVGNTFMSRCYAYNQPFPNSVTFEVWGNVFMQQCYSYNQPFPNSVTFNHIQESFMGSCFAFNQQLPVLYVNSASSNITILYNCISLNKVVEVDLSNVTGTSVSTRDSYALKGVRFKNMGRSVSSVDVSSGNLNIDALVNLFLDLYDRTVLTTGTITITNCSGVSSLLPDHIEIATNKNWTVVGG